MNPGGLIGETPRMKQIFEAIRKVAATDAPVLIFGEAGTGKTAIAEAIHQLSNRSQGPLMSLNCGAIQATLLESELFGHEKGAFTGAHEARVGLLEQADSGTLLLEEIDELNFGIQLRLLRFLQDKAFQRVGAHKSRNSDVRVICTAGKDLRELVAEGKFREDLFYRLAVIVIDLPPLRDRIEDLPKLASLFLEKAALEMKKGIVGFHPAAMQAMIGYSWRGNVRELRNAVRRAAVFCEGDLISVEDFPKSIFLGKHSESFAESYSAFLKTHAGARETGKRWRLEE